MRSNGFLVLACSLAFAIQGVHAEKTVPIADTAQKAVQQSQLTLPDGAAFHLKARIVEPANPQSDYRADVEEYWISPNKWRRSLQAPGFSQVLIVNEGKVSETNTGDYYPFWLNDLVTAMFDPLPMLDQLKRLQGVIELPNDSAQSTSCFNMQTHSGTPPARSTLPLAFCFWGKAGLLKSVVTPGYRAEFLDYKPFGKTQVARRILFDPQPGTSLAAEITALETPSGVDEKMFAVEEATPTAQMLKSVEVGEDTARRIIADGTEIKWPAVRRGKTSGLLTLLVSADRAGHVREAWVLGSENPALSEAARAQVLHWKFQPYVNGVAFQMKSVLTFVFSTTIENPIPLLNNIQARKLAARAVEARIPAGVSMAKKTFTLRIAVDEHGNLLGVQNPNNVDPRLYAAGERALRQWRFRPYSNNGKVDLFDADIIFRIR